MKHIFRFILFHILVVFVFWQKFIILSAISFMILWIFFIDFAESIARIKIAILDASGFRPVNRPRTLWIDKQTNTWQTGHVSDQTLWWRVFFNSLNGRPL